MQLIHSFSISLHLLLIFERDKKLEYFGKIMYFKGMRFNLLFNSFCHAVDKKYAYFYSLTFWSAFSFSSRLWVAWSRFVWVWVSSCSNCCIFFSNASTSSFAFYTHFLLSKCPVWTILLNKLHTTEYPVFVGVDLWFNIKNRRQKISISDWSFQMTHVLEGLFLLFEPLVCVH